MYQKNGMQINCENGGEIELCKNKTAMNKYILLVGVS